MLKKIIIIEDNKDLINFIKEFLSENGGFVVEGYTSGTEALKVLKLNKSELVIIDLELDDIRGETICMELRKLYPDLPIIILTGDKSQETTINALNAGADDYVTKPFNADVLLARINARLRNGSNTVTNILTAEDLSLNLETLEVERAKKKIDLTAKEFELLRYLLQNKSRILTREKILNAVWGYTTIVDTRVVDVHIGKLRDKLEKGFKTKLIETSRGFGYRING